MILCVTMNASIDRLYRLPALALGRVNRAQACIPTPGGKGLNVARVLQQLQVPVLATGIVAGHHGAWLESALDRLAVAHDFMRVPGETRACINIIEADRRQTEVLEPGPTLAPETEEAFLDKLPGMLEAVRVAVFSGSLPNGCGKDLYARMIALCHARGVRVILDTSGDPMRQGMEAHPALIKPNEDEIAALLDCGRVETEHALLEAAQSLHARGIGSVVVSLGSRGALLVCNEGAFRAFPPPVRAVNTTGCGDAMIAGFACCMLREDSPAQALPFATAVAASAATVMETGYIRAGDIPELLAGVRVEALRM